MTNHSSSNTAIALDPADGCARLIEVVGGVGLDLIANASGFHGVAARKNVEED